MDTQTFEAFVDEVMKRCKFDTSDSDRLTKLLEEAGELARAARKAPEEIVGEIGDMLFVLAGIAHNHGLTLNRCMLNVAVKWQSRMDGNWKNPDVWQGGTEQ